jgi:glycosyltransferase involved in cell wall biosynthesis
MRIAYVLSRYPKVSHTFIWREVAELRSQGFEIDTFSIWRTPEADLLSDHDRGAYETTFALRPPDLRTHLGAHVAAFLRRPGRYLGCLAHALRSSAPGLKERLKALVWFAESIVVWRQCEERGVEHLHAHFAGGPPAIASLASRYAAGAGRGPASWSFTVHGPVEFFDPRLKEMAEDADFVICISDFARSQIMALVDEGHWQKLHVVHCGVDIAAYRSALDAAAGAPDPEPNSAVLASTDATRLLFVGRVVSLKGHAVLLQAVAELVAAGRRISLVIVGDGPRREELMRLGRSLGLTDEVEWTGALAQDRLPLLYAEADVFCLPSFAEGVPTVLMEAMLTETPVVTTTIAGVPELVEDGVSGILVPPGRAEAIAAAVARLGEDPALRARMGRAGRSKVELEFDCRRSATQLGDAFRRQLRA